MIEDASAFYAKWRAGFGPLSQNEVEGINALLAEMDGRGWTDKRWWAYTLATAWHETASTMQPIAEYGKGKGRPYGKPDASTGQTYYGRGFVQLTWKENYERMGALLGVDLVHKPDLAMEPITAAQIMCLGMQDGLFTGKGLGDYFDGDTDDPLNARRIVNGTDKAKMIAGYHAKALAAVGAGWGEPKPVDRTAELEAAVAAQGERIAAFEAWAASVNAALDRLETRRAA
jgi:predicted chitinase